MLTVEKVAPDLAPATSCSFGSTLNYRGVSKEGGTGAMSVLHLACPLEGWWQPHRLHGRTLPLRYAGSISPYQSQAQRAPRAS